MTELTHNKLNLVYLAELLVVMTDWHKIITIHAWNVHHVHGHKRLDNDAVSHISLAPGKWRCCILDMRGCHSVETQKNSSWDNLHISGSGLCARRLSRQYAPSLWHQIWAVCNKSSV